VIFVVAIKTAGLRGRLLYNGWMNTGNDETTPVETEEDSPPEKKPSPPTLSPELLAAGRADKDAWKSGSGPGRWATIGCGLGVVVLIAALFAGSTLMRKTVWAGFAGAGQRVMANLPGDLSPGERMRLKSNLDRFAAYLKKHDEPFPVMGEFQALVREALEDRLITRDEVEKLNLFLEPKLAEDASAVPYSMP
jgi:hypothetical protein